MLNSTKMRAFMSNIYAKMSSNSNKSLSITHEEQNGVHLR